MLVEEQTAGLGHDLLHRLALELEIAGEGRHVRQARVAVVAQPVLDLEGLPDERIVDEDVRGSVGRPAQPAAASVSFDFARPG
ncbi:MAG TPA: hypothetical protein VIR58_17445 [Acidimicrobiales bacterium]